MIGGALPSIEGRWVNSMGTTADKITKAILAHERSGIIDLSSYRAEKVAVEDARLGDDRLRELLATGYDPAHAAFIYAQNFASFLSEQMSPMKELRQYASIVGKAEDDYQPSFPPLSPVTTSYSRCGRFSTCYSDKATKPSEPAFCASRRTCLSRAGSWTRSARCRSHAWAFTCMTVLRIASSACAKSTAKT